MSTPDFTSKAILNLSPDAVWTLHGSDINWVEQKDDNNQPTGIFVAENLEWKTKSIAIPSKEEIEAEVARLLSEYQSTQYQRQRQPEYPPLADLADALYWQSQGDDSKMTAYLAAVEAVKQKYPKV